ncbi:hypothetical protein D9M68_893350 [compost metagenome]
MAERQNPREDFAGKLDDRAKAGCDSTLWYEIEWQTPAMTITEQNAAIESIARSMSHANGNRFKQNRYVEWQ